MANKLKQMQEQINGELEHIPDWPEPQRELRMIYQICRMHSLGKKAVIKQTAPEVLKKCISDLKDIHPDFQFRFDENFFRF